MTLIATILIICGTLYVFCAGMVFKLAFKIFRSEWNARAKTKIAR